MNQSRKELLNLVDNVTLIVLGMLFLGFPLLFTSITTDAFALPKQLLLIVAISLCLLLFGARTLIENKIRLRTSPFDLPLVLMTIVVFVSAILAVNRYDALTAFLPFLFAVLAYFVIVNVVRDEGSLFFLLASLVIGSSLSAILTVLSFLKIYILPFQYTHTQAFNTYGSLLDQAMYLGLMLPVAGYFAYPLIAPLLTGRRRMHVDSPFADDRKTSQGRNIAFAGAFVLILLGLLATLFMLFTTQKPVLLPFETGFQTAFAAISQDAGRVLKSFLFGSGFGTYLTDFTRFKQAPYNLNEALWSFTFFRSSSFVLELLATTGLLGILSFLFLVFRIVKEKSFFLPLVVTVFAALVLPFSFTLVTLFFFILAIFATVRALQHPKRFPDVELQFAAMRSTSVLDDHGRNQGSGYARIFPILFFLIVAGVIATLGFFTVRYAYADFLFQRSLVAASQNNGGQTWDYQRRAIGQYPYRDGFYRVFSQTNLALANALAAQQPKDASPSAESQEQIIRLIQNSINSGRTAVTVSPQTSLNWNNLSSIYRALIGFGQNADQFAVLTNQQAIALDSNNPQQYINLGGIYYQLKLWDEAIRQFGIAVQLKPNYANAYYNLGHAYESKGELETALRAYERVKALTGSNKESNEKISKEIEALKAKIGALPQTPTDTTPEGETAENQEPIDLNRPTTQLPERNPQVEIPGPTTSVTPTPRAGTQTSPTPAAGTVTPPSTQINP